MARGRPSRASAGGSSGAPSAALAQTTLVVGARGTDGALWLNINSNGTWGGWQSVGGVLSAAPAVVGGADGRIDVFVRGTDDSLWTRALPPGGSWSPWTSLGGWLTTGPAGVYVDAVRLDVYAIGGDHAVWRRTWTGSMWSGWQSVGGQTYVAPTVAPSPQGDGAWVFVRGTGNGLYRQPERGSRWHRLAGPGWRPDRRPGGGRRRWQGRRRGARNGQCAVVEPVPQRRVVGLGAGMGAHGSTRTRLVAARGRLDTQSRPARRWWR